MGLCLGWVSAGSTPVKAETHLLPPPGIDLIGATKVHHARYEDTLMDIARLHDLGYDEILQANPDVDRWLPGNGTPVVLPARFILPPYPREGVVLNVAEKRLYYFPSTSGTEKPTVTTHPIGVGRMDWETPLGETKIVRKVANPDWRPPASIKKEHLDRYGEVLPDLVPAGPDNPLGAFALRLGIPGYLIHGTNKRDGVGSRVSHGCVRLYNEDIEHLFGQVRVGTPVHIINEPIKVGWYASELYIEVHAPLEEEQYAANSEQYALSLDAALEKIRAVAGSVVALRVDLDHLTGILAKASGMPVPVFR